MESGDQSDTPFKTWEKAFVDALQYVIDSATWPRGQAVQRKDLYRAAYALTKMMEEVVKAQKD